MKRWWFIFQVRNGVQFDGFNFAVVCEECARLVRGCGSEFEGRDLILSNSLLLMEALAQVSFFLRTGR